MPHVSYERIDMPCKKKCPHYDQDHPPYRKCGVFLEKEDVTCKRGVNWATRAISGDPNIHEVNGTTRGLMVEIKATQESPYFLDNEDFEGAEQVAVIFNGDIIPTRKNS